MMQNRSEVKEGKGMNGDVSTWKAKGRTTVRCKRHVAMQREQATAVMTKFSQNLLRTPIRICSRAEKAPYKIGSYSLAITYFSNSRIAIVLYTSMYLQVQEASVVANIQTVLI